MACFVILKNVHDVFAITTVVGILSSIIDNVPLVAACMGMYPVVTPDSIAAVASAACEAMASGVISDPEYMMAFAQDGLFWLLLTYCAGVGGSILIIGSAAGVLYFNCDVVQFLKLVDRLFVFVIFVRYFLTINNDWFASLDNVTI